MRNGMESKGLSWGKKLAKNDGSTPYKRSRDSNLMAFLGGGGRSISPFEYLPFVLCLSLDKTMIAIIQFDHFTRQTFI